ncbi:type IV pilus biogenesis protein PilP [Trinickia diaoshuihuensis]|uniref:type IV pilus biogenesis protein PilP n=1 Tax=Trinickia diaoshuihuensis TaxID=2292265 RepID=UPI000E26BEEC|nr:type IV pilus biogenesis protein PilP [Trinickia diaoshuihuensis]
MSRTSPFTSAAIVIASIAACLAPLAAGAQALGQPQLQAQAASAAKSQTPSSEASPAEELANLQAQIPILEAKAEIAKLKAQIENGGTAPSGLAQGMPSPMNAWGGTPAPASTSQSGSSSATSGSADKPGMQAVSISGFDGRYQAVLTIDGRTVSVRPGETIEGGWKVTSITESSVTLAHGKRVVVLRV